MKIGIALSGGGIRGIAHSGVLKALEEMGIKIDGISGTSSGSLIASLYAMGYSPYYIYVLFKRYADKLVQIEGKQIISGIGNFVWNKKLNVTGLNSGESLEHAYNEIAAKKGIKTMADISMPLVIPTVDVNSGEKYVFSSRQQEDEQYISDISVGKAVRASSSFPAVFCPCEYKGYRFSDGGILDNTPVYELKKQGIDKVIAVIFESDPITDQSNVMDLTMKIIDIMGRKISEESLRMADMIITVPSDGTGLLEVEKLDFCYQSGYKTTMASQEEIRKILVNV